MPGVFREQDSAINPNLCFVLMPFDPEFDAIFRLIQRVCQEHSLSCMRADADVKPGKISAKIYAYIRTAGVIIADTTRRNPNVFYELGLAHAISDNVILLTQSIEDVPFDIQDFSHIVYKNDFAGAEKLATDLSKVLTALVDSTPLSAARDPNVAKALENKELDPETDLDLSLVHLYAEIAAQDGDAAKARAILASAVEKAETGIGDAASLGNCGIAAEKLGFNDLALPLYEAAYDRDPTLVPATQAYVSFLLDEMPNDEEKFALAEKLLDELETYTERPERTKALRAQHYGLARAKGRVDDSEVPVGDIDPDELKTVEQAVAALATLRYLHRHKEMIELKDLLAARFERAETQRLTRVVIDALATGGGDEYKEYVIDGYRELLREGVYEDDPDVQHNLATTLAVTRGGKAEAEAYELWKAAYTKKPADQQIRRAFAGFLIGVGRVEEGGRVVRGESLD